MSNSRPAPRLDGVSERIWRDKYAYDGDASIEDTWRRVARALASPEADPDAWEPRFMAALEDFRFIPAGRILAGAGAGRSVTLFNCFVMGTIADDMSGIFDSVRQAALTMQAGGGVGMDFSTLRPRGAPVRGVGADASGPLSFMDVWNTMCGTIMSAGSRRGAMMATMRSDHPDIEQFIDAKRNGDRLRMFNLSVLVTDRFMAAVDGDTDWDLVFAGEVHRTVRARDLWRRIVSSNHQAAEPGVIFMDRINARNPLAYAETIAATNPCGEQPLPPYGACLLGALNLAMLVRDPFEPDATLDIEALADLVPVAVRMLDNVIDISRYPLAEQAAEAKAKRRLGLGITGLANALIMCGVRYGSLEAVALTEAWMRAIRDAAWRASVDLAREKGPFPLFEAEPFLASETVAALPDDIRAGIAKHGVRNGLLTSVAPTGTTSLLAHNVSSGIEPVFAFQADRAVLEPDGSRRTERVEDYAFRLWRERNGDAPPPDCFVSAQTLRPEDHIAMQAAAQKYIDAAISKTVICPADIPFADFERIYRLAWETGCKGCTTYRPNAVTGSVLSVRADPETPAAPPGNDNPPGPEQGKPMARPAELSGTTYKRKWPHNEHAYYITINDIVGNGRRRPFEIFIASANLEPYAWTVALTRTISAIFRRGGDVSFVAEELQQIFDPRGGAWIDRRYVPSVVAAIGGVVQEHLDAIAAENAGGSPSTKPADPPEDSSVEPAARSVGAAAVAASGPLCPRCQQPGLTAQEGCLTCASCGYSKCG